MTGFFLRAMRVQPRQEKLVPFLNCGFIPRWAAQYRAQGITGNIGITCLQHRTERRRVCFEPTFQKIRKGAKRVLAAHGAEYPTQRGRQTPNASRNAQSARQDSSRFFFEYDRVRMYGLIQYLVRYDVMGS